jgi:menaquinone-dependent protoporphyrinogen oxidase
MPAPILVAYVSKYGSTAEVAEAVAEVLRAAGAEVDVLPARKVRDIGPYGLVVLGVSIRMGKPLGGAMRFARKFRGELAGTRVVVFALGLGMREDTPENRVTMRGFLSPLLEILGEPWSLGLFGGRLDYRKLGAVFRWMFRRDTTGEMREGDWRDWQAIRQWAENLAGIMF